MAFRTNLNLSEPKKEFVSSTNHSYTEEELITTLRSYGCLINYKAEGGYSLVSRWYEPFSESDLIRVFSEFPNVYDMCVQQMNACLKQKELLHIDDTVYKLLKMIVDAGRPFHQNWSQNATFDIDTVSDALRSPLEQLQIIYLYDQKLKATLDNLSDLINYQQARGNNFTDDVNAILDKYICSAGFIHATSHLFSMLNTTRCILAYENRDDFMNEYHIQNVAHIRFFNPESSERSFKRKFVMLDSFSGLLDSREAACILKDKPEGYYFLRYSRNHQGFCVSYNREEKGQIMTFNMMLKLNEEINTFKPFVENDNAELHALFSINDSVKLYPMHKGDVLTLLDQLKLKFN